MGHQVWIALCRSLTGREEYRVLVRISCQIDKGFFCLFSLKKITVFFKVGEVEKNDLVGKERFST